MKNRRALEGRWDVWATTWQSPLQTPGQRVRLHLSHPSRAFEKVVSTDNKAEKSKTGGKREYAGLEAFVVQMLKGD